MKSDRPRGKILIIDDDEKIGNLLKLYLVKKGFLVSVIMEAEEAERSIDREKPDLIFLDYRMAPLTGKDILERLKVSGNKTPVVMMSAYKRRNGDLEMRRLGAMAYLPKPFDFSKMEEVLSMIFST